MAPKQKKAKNKGGLRTTQLITTYGIGAIVAVEEESFMVTSTDRWPDSPEIDEPRLARQLNAYRLIAPPHSVDTADIPVVRFPRWYSCPECKRIASINDLASMWDNHCNQCQAVLVPSRFVMACAQGHIDDFPYFAWLHKGNRPEAGRSHAMRIEAEGATASLRDIVLSCECGVPPTSLDNAFSRYALRDVVAKCPGKRPWLPGPDAAETCSEMPRTLQRGASNVWFSVMRSALSIPPWSEGAYKALSKVWKILRVLPDDALADAIRSGVAPGSSYSVEELVAAVRRRKREESGEIEVESIRDEEYEALCRGRTETSWEQDFVCEPVPDPDGQLAPWFERIMRVRRLREVRALEAFTRVLPASVGGQDRYAPVFGGEVREFPAIEVRGEGVFLQLATDRLDSWERSSAVVQRVTLIDDAYRRRAEENGQVPERTITPRLALVHTLAHALINQWALDSGYSAGELRERLYASVSMAGFLIYTASSDSAGSLGGVVSQATPERLSQTLAEAIHDASWCSADPLCLEAGSQGADALNLAACHACVLLPETSCEEMNVLLDRALLVGSIQNPAVGFFADLAE